MNARIGIETYHALRQEFDPFKIADVLTTFAVVDETYTGGVVTTSERSGDIQSVA